MVKNFYQAVQLYTYVSYCIKLLEVIVISVVQIKTPKTSSMYSIIIYFSTGSRQGIGAKGVTENTKFVTLNILNSQELESMLITSQIEWKTFAEKIK